MRQRTKTATSLVVTVLVALTLAGCSSAPSTIPNLVGKPADAAEKTLTADNIPWQTTTDSDKSSVKIGAVASQTPKAGTSNTGQIVILTIQG